MANILIRMEMPKTCSQCPLCYDYMMCSLRDGRFSHMGESFDCCEMRLADCPLVELPTHGDLIDRNALVAEIKKNDTYQNWIFRKMLKEQPVIVPAERSDTDA